MKPHQLLDTFGYKMWRDMEPLHMDFFMMYEKWKNPNCSTETAFEKARCNCMIDLSEFNPIEEFHIRRFMKEYVNTTKFQEWLSS